MCFPGILREATINSGFASSTVSLLGVDAEKKDARFRDEALRRPVVRSDQDMLNPVLAGSLA